MAKAKNSNTRAPMRAPSRPNEAPEMPTQPVNGDAKSELSKQEKMLAKQLARSAKFRKNAPRAMTQALRALAKVDALTNNRRYSWEPKHAEQMIAALDKAVNAIKVKFENPGGKSGGFELE